MPNPIEKEIERQRRFSDFMEWLVFGKPEDMDKPLKWYHWMNIIMKILTPICALFFYIIHWYWISLYFYFCFVLDYAILLHSLKIGKRYREYQELMKEVKEVGNQWGK